MASAIRVSVCMAAYRGTRFIEQQIESILEQLGPDDELVVVDDASPDGTADLVAAVPDERIRLLRGHANRGYVRAFEEAIKASRGEYVFLADQDDVWLPGRLQAMLSALQSSAVVSTSVSVLGEPVDPPRFRLRSSDSHRYGANLFAVMIGYRPYTGCAMAFRRDILDSVVPIPAFLYESHDLWLAMIANTHRENCHLDASSVARRLHDANQTPLGWRSLSAILRARWMKLRALRVARHRAQAYQGPAVRRLS